MCTSPIKIINPKLKSAHSAWNAAVDPVYLKVPCGRCRQCQIHKQQDILVRLAYEYEYTIKNGGFVLFDTFTYNESNVPRWHGLMCFNSNHYRDFCKKLRVYLTRHYEDNVSNYSNELFATPYLWDYIYDNSGLPQEEKQTEELRLQEREDTITMEETGDLYNFFVKFNHHHPTAPEYHPRGKIKIFWVSEYGGEYQRPHYHALFFVTMKGITPLEFRNYVRKSWIYGFTDKRNINKMIIHDFSGIAYVSKYVCKDIEYIKTITQQKGSSFMPYFKARWQQLYGEEFDQERLKKMPCETIKKLLHDIGMSEAVPFNRWSRNMGISILGKITEKDIELGTMSYKDTRGNKRINIPEYIKRKIEYDYVKEIKYWQLNDTGKICKMLQHENQKQRVIIDLDIAFNQLKVQGINNDYKKRLYELIYTDKNKYNELITTILNRNKMITNEIRPRLNAGEGWREIMADEILNNYEEVGMYSDHTPHQWIIHAIRNKQLRYIQLVDGTHTEVKQAIEIYDKAREQMYKDIERRLNTKWKAERIQKNLRQGGAKSI